MLFGDEEGAGEVAPITPDAMRHVKAWIAAAGIVAIIVAVVILRRFGGV